MYKRQVIRPSPPPLFISQDYSAIALRPAFDGSTDWAVAISSQENAAVWLGRLTLNPQPGSHGAPHYDPARFALSKGRIYDFPRDNECRRIYCNIEGIAWQGEDKLVAASDQASCTAPRAAACAHRVRAPLTAARRCDSRAVCARQRR